MQGGCKMPTKRFVGAAKKPRWMLLGIAAIIGTGYAAPQGEKGRDYFESTGQALWEVRSDQKVIAMTFDDGPDPVKTALILDVLKEYEAKATFFVIGKNAEKYPDVVRREAEEGHEVANHTYTHLMRQPPQVDKLIREVKRSQAVLTGITGIKPVLFRPPGGIYNERMLQAMKQEGMMTILWSWHQDTRDWARPGTSAIVNKVMRNVRSGDIILFHDRVEHSMQTIEALKQILPSLKKQGYRFVTVSELIRYDSRPIWNKAEKP